MYKYKTIVYWSEEFGHYIAEVPELPGCIADGKTPNEAMANAQENIGLWIETAKEIGRPIPSPVVVKTA